MRDKVSYDTDKHVVARAILELRYRLRTTFRAVAAGYAQELIDRLEADGFRTEEQGPDVAHLIRNSDKGITTRLGASAFAYEEEADSVDVDKDFVVRGTAHALEACKRLGVSAYTRCGLRAFHFYSHEPVDDALSRARRALVPDTLASSKPYKFDDLAVVFEMKEGGWALRAQCGPCKGGQELHRYLMEPAKRAVGVGFVIDCDCYTREPRTLEDLDGDVKIALKMQNNATAWLMKAMVEARP